MRIRAALMIAMAASIGAWAEAPKPANPAPTAGERWDDSHMRSRHQDVRRTERPRIQGESGYGALSSGNATASAPSVQELEFTTQREWEQGALSTGSNERARATASAGEKRPSGRISRNSQIRAESTSRR
jgi:hypothetical protein